MMSELARNSYVKYEVKHYEGGHAVNVRRAWLDFSRLSHFVGKLLPLNESDRLS